MSKPDMGSIFHINKQWNILVKGNYYVNYQNYQNSMLLTSSDTKHWGIYSCLQIPPGENWFQYVRRVLYTTAIKFPCITFLNKGFKGTVENQTLPSLRMKDHFKVETIYSYSLFQEYLNQLISRFYLFVCPQWSSKQATKH